MTSPKALFAAFLVAFSFLALPHAADAQVVQGRWARFTHPNFGTQIVYPYDVFQNYTETADGAMFSGKGASLEVSAKMVPEIRSAGQLRSTIANAPGYENVTYSRGGRNWIVVSGLRGNKIFYEKFFVRGGAVQGFSVSYPSNARAYFDPLVEHMENTFQPGFR